MRTVLHVLFFHFLLIATVSAQVTTTYGVEGWATHTVGGRGGKIVKVTNLNASGVGSFAAALAASGPRIIVFEVGGVINLNGQSLSLNNPDVTIAGQTAPGKGITLINGGLSIRTHDVIVQHLRIRPGSTGHAVGSWEPDGLTTDGAGNVVIDHCSFSWAVDENCSASGPRFEGANPEEWRNNTSHAVTISYNIIAEGLSHSTHTKGEHSKGTLVHDNTKEIAILNNLYAHNVDRNPLFKGGARGVVVNNFIYNPGVAAVKFGLVDSEWLGYVKDTGKMTLVGNYLKYGPNTSSIAFCNIGNGPCEVFLSDNLSLNRVGGLVAEYKGDVAKRVFVKPVWNENIRVIPATEVQQNVVRQAGARPWDRDDIDNRIVLEAVNGTGSIIDSETSVGGYPSYPLVSQAFDEAAWNLDCMLKINPDVTLELPTSNGSYQKDAPLTISAIRKTGTACMDLLLNGTSQGLRSSPPYTWQLRIPTTGTHRLVVVTNADSLFKTVTPTSTLVVTDSLANSLRATDRPSRTSTVFPNPFSNHTKLSYVLAEPGPVGISVYNGQGMLVEAFDSKIQESGRHEWIWAPTTLPGGLYFVCFKSASGTNLHKIIHSKSEY